MKYYLLLCATMLIVGLAGIFPADALAAANPAADSVVEMIHLNQASAEELQLLPGVGPALSERIIRYRTDNGAFSSVDQLVLVKGISDKKLAKIKSRLTIR